MLPVFTPSAKQVRSLADEQLSDLAMIPTKDARQLLYKMMASKFVSYQEVPKNSTMMPNHTIYCWSVNLQQVG